MGKPRAYELHEQVYRDLNSKNLENWSDKDNKVTPPARDGIDVHDERFLEDALAQGWAPKVGKAIEFGCGTGPMVRWLARRGFKGLGIDVSPTAIRMAKRQCKGNRGVQFRCADALQDDIGEGKYDLALDGRWLHCITEPGDRKRAFRKARQALRKGGVFLVLTMCAPLEAQRFSELYPHQKVRNHVIYQAFEGAERFDGCRTIQGKACLPLRYVGHWKSILKEVQAAGFETRLMRLNRAHGDEAASFLNVAAVAL